MKDEFCVFSPGRCGSILAARIISNLYRSLNPTVTNEFILVFDKSKEIDTSKYPVIHTHILDTLVSHSSRIRIICVRNIIESAISTFISEKTDIWAIKSAKDNLKFTNQWHQDRSFDIDPDDFVRMCNFIDDQYTRAIAACPDAIVINYKLYKDNHSAIFDILRCNGLDIGQNNPFLWNLPVKNTIKKSMIVKNYDEIINISMPNLRNNFQ